MWASGISGGASELSDLSDVNVPSPNDSDIMEYDNGSGLWLPVAPSGGGETFVNRGNLSAWDYTQAAGLTINSDYQVLDLSSICPAGAANKLVQLRWRIKSTGVGHSFFVKVNGHANDINSDEEITLVASVWHHGKGYVELDADRKIAYYGTTGMEVSLAVRGWWI